MRSPRIKQQRRERIAKRYAPSFESILDKMRSALHIGSGFLMKEPLPFVVVLCAARVLSLFLPPHQRALAPIRWWL